MQHTQTSLSVPAGFRWLATLAWILLSNWTVGVAQHTVLPSADHDFGIVKQGQKLTHTFTIRNAGTSPLRIDRIELSARGITTRFRPDIQPGEEGRISLEWDTSSANGETEATAVVRLSGTDQSEIPLQLRVVVKPPVEFSPFPAVFFAVYQDELMEKRVQIINNEEAPLQVELIEFPREHYEVTLDTVESGKLYDLRVKVRPNVPLGRYTERIIIQVDRPEKRRMQIAANLFVKPDFYAFPETLDFGSVTLETLDRQPQLLEVLNQTTIVTNRSGPVEIRSIESDVPFLEVDRNPSSGPSEQFRLNVALSRQKMTRGKFGGTLRIITTDPRIPELFIPVRGQVN